MKRMIENLTGNYTASASVVDGTLIISLPDAVSPVVWRLDLGQARASAMEVRPLEDGRFNLVLKTPRNDVNEIASFSSKARAVAALMAISRAMEQAHGQIQPVANDSIPAGQPSTNTLPVPVRTGSARKKSATGKNVLAGVIALVLIIVLIGAMMSITPTPSPMTRDLSSGVAPSGGGAGNLTGVPLSADEFLMNR